MLLVDSQQRASLEEVANHPWLQEGESVESNPSFPGTAISNMDELPKSELDVILHRMEQGGYGSMDSILKYANNYAYIHTHILTHILTHIQADQGEAIW